MDKLLDHLSKQQREAVEYINGPSLIIAGAGSGKTRVLTYKIAYLLQQGYIPQSILALTFTNKAAREMKERIAQLIGWQHARYLWMGTFHSVFSRILRTEAEKIGFTANFTVFDSADSRNMIKTIIKQFQLDDKVYKPARVQAIISNAKNALVSPQMYAQNKELIECDQRAKMPVVKDIYREYNNRLKASNTMDFDDLLFHINCLFRDFPDVLKNYQERYQFILVDEYQDTNFAQYLVVKQLADAHHRVCVVGDDAQSIYSFRGANIDNILKFKEIYSEAKLFKLEQNYRSTRNIVNAANSLIQQNREQIKKTIYSENEEGDRIEVSGAYSDFEEGIIVSNKIWNIRREKKAAYSDFVVLYRTNAQSRIFEEALRRKNIPYRIYGGLSFYQRKEIKDVIAYLRMVVNPYDEEAFRRIINFPARGIGNTTLNKIADSARLHDVSLWTIIGDPLGYNLNVNAGTAKKLSEFRELIDGFISRLRELPAYELVSEIVKQSGIVSEAYQDQTPEGMSRQENLQELLGGIHEFCESRKEEGSGGIGLMDFLSEVSLLSDQDTDKEADKEKVTMMTVHASKGLEFKNVFIVGMEEDLFPSALAKNESRGLEEERRLFYVAITRAREYCMITYANSRFRNGQINSSNPSRFLRDIDACYLNTSGGALGGRFGVLNRPETYTKDLYDYTNTPPHTSYPERPATQPNPPTPATEPVPASVPRRSNRVSTRNATPKPSAVANSGEVQPGAIIKHERFGVGKVLAVGGDPDSRKATVEFENLGVKQLLLKFARFEVTG
ncbi:MAG: UvrD-helicase domain-containing protein [Prevotella sp.]|jgi:DNA helicase-2/ATP-dependent DNA helicase PcrA|nr:UvrD-helicase domain-containing protein [Prevotella sp.]